MLHDQNLVRVPKFLTIGRTDANNSVPGLRPGTATETESTGRTPFP